MSTAEGFGRAVRDAHSGYHAETRRHHTPDALVDDCVTWPMLSPHLMRARLFVVVPTVLVLIRLVLSWFASMSNPDPFVDGLIALLGVAAVVLYLAGIASLFAPAKEPIAEYSQLIEGRGSAAPTAYDWVRRAAAARRAPAEITTGSPGGVPVLLFAQNSERAMLMVQAYGDDLYVGWTMWRARSSATMLAHFLRDTFGRLGSGPRYSAELRAASTRALRESVHSLAREGVLAAVHGQDVQDTARGGAPREVRRPEPHAAPHAAPQDAERDEGWGDGWQDAPAAGVQRGELPQPAPAWSEHDLYRPRREPQPASEPRRRSDPAGNGWGPPPVR